MIKSVTKLKKNIHNVIFWSEKHIRTIKHFTASAMNNSWNNSFSMQVQSALFSNWHILQVISLQPPSRRREASEGNSTSYFAHLSKISFALTHSNGFYSAFYKTIFLTAPKQKQTFSLKQSQYIYFCTNISRHNHILRKKSTQITLFQKVKIICLSK